MRGNTCHPGAIEESHFFAIYVRFLSKFWSQGAFSPFAEDATAKETAILAAGQQRRRRVPRIRGDDGGIDLQLLVTALVRCAQSRAEFVKFRTVKFRTLRHRIWERVQIFKEKNLEICGD